MLPSIASHLGDDYDLSHLHQQFYPMSWQCQDGVQRDFSFRVRYSSHCISETVYDPQPADSQLFGNGNDVRVFDTDRFEWSKELPALIQQLCAKPSTSIQMTPEQNGYVFHMRMQHPLESGERYYIFVRMKRPTDFDIERSPTNLDLFIESAYARTEAPIKIKYRPMFGLMAEKLLE